MKFFLISQLPIALELIYFSFGRSIYVIKIYMKFFSSAKKDCVKFSTK